jgi:hypothetical protein
MRMRGDERALEWQKQRGTRCSFKGGGEWKAQGLPIGARMGPKEKRKG